ncbi:MAG: 16S rRNA (adenine(1518)-N(6)/adenine(1519)-N(6))-dimethyltransferase RsmA [Anaeroplasmataceae bacterium]
MPKKVGSIEYTKKVISDNNFYIKKKFGQNFLIDQNILNNIVDSAEIDNSCDVIEIGPGLGSLTEIIAAKANRVLCYEIDSDLIPILNENLSEFNNITIINKDVLKCDVNKDIDIYFPNSKKVVLIANLPYYITTPIILGLLEQTTKIKEYVMMMQEEVADRITSKPNVKDYNALSIAIQYRCKASKVLRVSRNVFIPAPNVDSAVIRLDLYDNPIYKPNNEEKYFKLVRGAFSQRRKTLVNNLSQMGYSKDDIYNALDILGLDKAIRSEALSVKEFVELSDILDK